MAKNQCLLITFLPYSSTGIVGYNQNLAESIILNNNAVSEEEWDQLNPLQLNRPDHILTTLYSCFVGFSVKLTHG